MSPMEMDVMARLRNIRSKMVDENARYDITLLINDIGYGYYITKPTELGKKILENRKDDA